MHQPLVPAWGAVGAVSNDAAVRNGAAAAPGPPRAAVASQACELPVTTGGSAVGAVGARIAAAAPAQSTPRRKRALSAHARRAGRGLARLVRGSPMRTEVDTSVSVDQGGGLAEWFFRLFCRQLTRQPVTGTSRRPAGPTSCRPVQLT